MKQMVKHFRKTGMALAILSMATAASADLQFTVTVAESGSVPADTPKAGQYMVAYRSGLARIDRPDGTIVIFDFQAGKSATMDPSKKTYTLANLAEGTKATEGTTGSLVIAIDSTAKQTKAFGTTARKLRLSSNGSGAEGTAVYLKHSFVWVADGAKVSAAVSSVSPLLLAGYPKAWVQTMASSFDAKTAIPVYGSMTWSNGASLDVTVDSIDTNDLGDDAFTIPKKYKQADTAKK